MAPLTNEHGVGRLRGVRLKLLEPSLFVGRPSSRLVGRAALRGSDVGHAFPGDVISRAMRRRAHREIEAAKQGDAAVEADELHGDLALVVVHRQHGIELALIGAHENGVGRVRAIGVDAFALGLLNRGLNDLDFFTAKVPPSPACGLRPATAIRGLA